MYIYTSTYIIIIVEVREAQGKLRNFSGGPQSESGSDRMRTEIVWIRLTDDITVLRTINFCSEL